MWHSSAPVSEVALSNLQIRQMISNNAHFQQAEQLAQKQVSKSLKVSYRSHAQLPNVSDLESEKFATGRNTAAQSRTLLSSADVSPRVKYGSVSSASHLTLRPSTGLLSDKLRPSRGPLAPSRPGSHPEPEKRAGSGVTPGHKATKSQQPPPPPSRDEPLKREVSAISVRPTTGTLSRKTFPVQNNSCDRLTIFQKSNPKDKVAQDLVNLVPKNFVFKTVHKAKPKRSLNSPWEDFVNKYVKRKK